MGLSVLASIYEGTNSKELSECLDSLEAQTLPADEIVLVIDGPITSSVRACVDRYSVILPIRILKFSQNRGLGPALHDGLLACSHDLIARVDTDDRSLPARFETQVRFLQQTSLVSVVGSMMREQNHKNTKTGSLVRTMPLSHDEISRTARKRNPINHPTVVFRKNDIIASGNYGDYRFFEDYELWARVILREHHLANIDQILVETETNTRFFARRRGLSYIHHEIRFARRLYETRFLSFRQFILFMITRIPLRLVPTSIIELFYRTSLRTTEST